MKNLLTNKILFKINNKEEINKIFQLWNENIDCKFMNTKFNILDYKALYLEFETLGAYGINHYNKINELIKNDEIKTVFYIVENDKVKKVS